MLLYDMSAKTLLPLSPEQTAIDVNELRSWEFVWDPFTKTNYVYLSNEDAVAARKDGWYSCVAVNDQLAFSLKSKNMYWAQASPPYVHLNDSRFFVSRYEYNRSASDHASFMKASKSYFEIIDKKTNEKKWEFFHEGRMFTDLFWVTDRWYIKKTTPSFAGGSYDRIHTISNYETGETLSFEPECIIGYGDGVILTTTEKQAGFTGITVWTPEKEILYRDSNFLISGIIDMDYEKITYERPAIFRTYFDYPYVYCDILRVQNIGVYYSTLVMNTIGNPPALPGDSKTLSFAGVLKYL
jgi:hypothetical protein